MADLISRVWKQLKNGLFRMFAANILNKIVGMASSMVITRLLTKSEYGIWSYSLNIYSYLLLVTGLGLLSGAFQFGAESRGTDKEFSYYRFCMNVGLFIDVILVSVFIAVCWKAPFSLPEAKPYIIAVIPLLLIEYVMNLLLTILRCESRINDYAKILNRNTILLAVGTCAGAVFGIMGVIIGRYMAYGISLLQVIRHTKKEIGMMFCVPKIKWRETKPLWHYSLFTGASSALNCMLYLLDVSMIAALLQNSSEVAVYKVATLLPTALAFVPNSVVTCVLPDIVRNRNDHLWLRKNIKRYFIGLGSLNFLICSALIIFAPFVIGILSGSQYLEAVYPFRILTAGYFISGTFKTFSTNLLAGLRRVNYGLFLSVSAGTCNIVFNYVFIRKYGMVGAAYATFGTIAVAAVMAFSYLIIIVYAKKEKRKEC